MITGIVLVILGLVIVVISRMAPISVDVQRIFDIIGVIVAVIGAIFLILALIAYHDVSGIDAMLNY